MRLLGRNGGSVSAALVGRYCVGAGISFGLNLTLTWLLHDVLGAAAEMAFGVALVTVHTVNFFVGRHYIWGAQAGHAASQFARFSVSAAGFRIGEYVGFLVLHTLLHFPYLLVAAMVLAVSSVFKFFFYGSRVFVVPDERRVP